MRQYSVRLTKSFSSLFISFRWSNGPENCRQTLLHRAIDENNETVACFLIRRFETKETSSNFVVFIFNVRFAAVVILILHVRLVQTVKNQRFVKLWKRHCISVKSFDFNSFIHFLFVFQRVNGVSNVSFLL